MKVTIIGGGSYTWAFGFCRQFVLSEQLQGVHVTLMDTNPAALALVHAAATRFNLAHGSPITLESSSNLEAALDGADYVVVSISTGGLEAMQHDIAIPERYGILHTVGDTVGPGGLLRAVRNIPVFHDFGEKMKRLCPNAWLINVSNPLTPLTRVPQRNFGIRSIGMCPGVETCVRSLAEIAGAAPGSPVDYTVTGIDHGSWFTRIAAGNLDVMQRLKEMGYCRSDDRLPDQALTEDPHIGLVSGMRAGFAIWRELGTSQASGIAIPLKTGPGSLLAITRDCPLVFSVPRLKPGGGHRRTRRNHCTPTSTVGTNPPWDGMVMEMTRL